MTLEQKLENMKRYLDENPGYDFVGVYESQEAQKCYGRHLDPWMNERHDIYPVAWNRIIMTMGSVLSVHISAIFFGIRFLGDPEFMNDVLDTMESYDYSPERIKICFYKIVN